MSRLPRSALTLLCSATLVAGSISADDKSPPAAGPTTLNKVNASWSGKLSKVKIGVGPSAYDDFPEPVKSKLIASWKYQLDSLNDEAKDFKAGADKASAALANAKTELTKFEIRNAAELKAKDQVFIELYKKKVAAVDDAQAKLDASETVVSAARDRIAAHQKNTPPYFGGPFAKCKTTADIEARLDAIEQAERDKADKQAKADAEKKAEEEFDSDGLVLLQKTVKGAVDRFGGEITGTVVNRRAKEIRYAQITFALYDRTGAQVGTATASISGLEAGARWNFKAAVLDDNVASIKIKDLVGR